MFHSLRSYGVYHRVARVRFAVPYTSEDPKDDKENEIKEHCMKVMGGAINPVKRENNPDLQATIPVKEYIINTHTL